MPEDHGDFNPHLNGTVQEVEPPAAADTDPPAPDDAETARIFRLELGVNEIADEAETVKQMLERFAGEPLLSGAMQDYFEPLMAQLRKQFPPLDEDEAAAEYPYGDAYNARALIQAHRHELRYVVPWKSWLVWSGNAWERETTGLLWRWYRQLMLEFLALRPQLPEAEQDACLKHVARSLNVSRVEAALKMAQSWAGISLGTEQFDADPWLLNCANGTLDLSTGQLREANPADLLTKVAPVDYDPAATCPTWLAFLRRIMGGAVGPDDPDMSMAELEARAEADARAQVLIDFHQRWVGYSLTGDTREQCLCLLHGSGANGKSTYLETLRAMLGAYALSTPSASLLAKERSDSIPNDIARLRGARIVTAVEIGEGKRLDEELLKRLTGQDVIVARFLRAEFFEFVPEFHLLVACNHLPAIRGTDHAIWRRIHCIPFTVTIPEAEQDKDLGAKLKAELPGILAWAVRGCLEWQKDGLQVPDIVNRTTSAYRSDMDTLGRFLEECCVLVDGATVQAGTLYEAYKKWCHDSGEQQAMSLTAMGKSLDDRKIAKDTSKNRVYRLGIGLKDAVPDEIPRSH